MLTILPKIVTDGLVLYLDAANPFSYPGSGDTWFDLTGYRNNGTLINGPTFDSANGGSFVFDGVDDYVSTTINLGSNPLPTHTISLWFKTNNANGAKIIGIEDQQTGETSIYTDRQLWVGTNGQLYYGVAGVGINYIVASTVITDNIWRNITVIATGTNSISLYINGELDITGTGNGFASYPTSYIRIGSFVLNTNGVTGWPNAVSGYFSGSIAITKIYNRALTGQEVLQNYDALKYRFGL